MRAWDGRSVLPDEDPARGKIWFSTGALDNVRLRHFGLPETPENAITRLFRALERAVDDTDRVTLYRLMMQYRAVEHADAFVARVAESSLDREAMAEVARWLASEAADREPAKYGLALLAVCGSQRDAELVMTYARHDEFTMYAASAIERIADDPLTAELAMAEQAHGWGKIALVERIAARGGDRADVRDWLLRRGCANEVMDEYLAYACATAGRLHEALAAETIDPELRRGACTIVPALIVGGPAEDIDDYEHGLVVVEHFLRHLDGTTEPEELSIVALIGSWAGRDETRAHLAAKAREILRGGTVIERLRSAFLSGDRAARFSAWSASHPAGLDLWEDAFELLRREPLTDYLYQWLTSTRDPMRLRRVIAFAEEHLPLESIATGPANELGFGGKFTAHSCLVMVLQELPERGQFSARLVMAALRSPVVNNRNFARRNLEATPREEWGAAVLETLRRAAAEEPNAELKRGLQALLS